MVRPILDRVVVWPKHSAVLFDLDGTLVDRTSALREFLPPFSRMLCPDSAKQQADFVRRFHELDADGYGDKSALFGTLCREFDLTADPVELLDDFRSRCWQEASLFTGAERMLASLREAGYRLALVSNGSSSSQRAKVEAAGLQGWFDAMLISGEQGVSKPGREIFERVAGKLGMPASDCVFVGDHPEKDVVGAARVGMTTVWVSHGATWPSGMEERPTYTVTSVREVAPLISRRPVVSKAKS